MIKQLLEATRAELLTKSRQGSKYNGQKINRFDAKNKCKVANTVADYNEIDMNQFWKDDILTFVVKIKGETNNYDVTISFNKLHKKIENYVRATKNKFNRDIVAKALMDAISSSDVKVDCTCPDFKYRLAYFATKNGFKAGVGETRASDITNPMDNKGACCKHILAALNNAMWIRNVASVIVNYANYCRDNMEYNYSRFIFPKIYGIPYQKAVQLTMDDFDSNGELVNDLQTDESIINLANAVAKNRFRGKKKVEQALTQQTQATTNDTNNNETNNEDNTENAEETKEENAE